MRVRGVTAAEGEVWAHIVGADGSFPSPARPYPPCLPPSRFCPVLTRMPPAPAGAMISGTRRSDGGSDGDMEDRRGRGGQSLTPRLPSTVPPATDRRSSQRFAATESLGPSHSQAVYLPTACRPLLPCMFLSPMASAHSSPLSACHRQWPSDPVILTHAGRSLSVVSG